MEMADYERLVKELNSKLTESNECAEELKAQINALNQKEGTLKQEIGMYGMRHSCKMYADVHTSRILMMYSLPCNSMALCCMFYIRHCPWYSTKHCY